MRSVVYENTDVVLQKIFWSHIETTEVFSTTVFIGLFVHGLLTTA